MSDDRHPEFDAIEALLRPTSEDSRPLTRSELDDEFEAAMSLLDSLDDRKAAELDDLVARAKADLADAAEDDHDRGTAGGHPAGARFRFKEVIHGERVPDGRVEAARPRAVSPSPAVAGLRDILIRCSTPLILLAIVGASLALLALDPALVWLPVVASAGWMFSQRHEPRE